MADARGSDERALTISVVMVRTVVIPVETEEAAASLGLDLEQRGNSSSGFLAGLVHAL